MLKLSPHRNLGTRLCQALVGGRHRGLGDILQEPGGAAKRGGVRAGAVGRIPVHAGAQCPDQEGQGGGGGGGGQGRVMGEGALPAAPRPRMPKRRRRRRR